MKVGMLRLLAAVGVPALVLAACGDDDDDTSSATTEAPADAPALEGDITVFAAASLTDAFTELGTTFESENPDASVEFNFGASSALREPGGGARGRLRLGEHLEHGSGRRRCGRQ